MRELSDDECQKMAQRVFGYPCSKQPADNTLIRAGYAAGYRAAQAAMPPREPTRHPCGHLIVSDECVVCAQEQTSGSTAQSAPVEPMTQSRESRPGPLDHQSAATPAEPHGSVWSGRASGADGPAADPIADLRARLRSHYKRGGSFDCELAADALERLARERDSARHSDAHTLAVLKSAERDYLTRIAELQARAERAEAERDALRAIVRAADAMRAGTDCPLCDYGKLRNPAKEHWESCGFGQYDRARAAWKGEA